jgi:putative membrane protein
MNPRTVTWAATAALWIATAATSALAQSERSQPATSATAGAGQSTGQGRMADADRQFVERAAGAGMAEVELGQLAQQKASSQQIKVFAARMVQDHSKANEELKQLAQAKGMTVPAAGAKAHRGEMDKLNKLSGADFDKQYVSHMVSDHRKTVAEFKKASESAQDLDLKAFAGKTLPTLQDHLNQAQSIQESVKSASK